jgi:fructokinase
VDQALIARSDRPTTLAFVVLTGGNASYAFYDENTAGRMLSEADLPAIPDTCAAGFFGGISLAVEPCAEAYTTLAARMSEAGKLVMLDPNIRPGFIADEARYRARMDRLMSLADVVKVSDEDLAWLMGDGDLDAKAEAMRATRPLARARHPRRGGRDGLWRGRPGHHPPTPVAKVVDTVGAGDTFNAGFLAGLSDAGRFSADAVRAGLPRTRCARARPRRARRRRHRVSRGRQPAPPGRACREGPDPARHPRRGRRGRQTSARPVRAF